ncbi:uncharacterized protein LOC129593222 [Paramacrobiotus metropolitanus]|uniref:uncharacterized protein LOC129593222 n=1 Tax=Paramacrobiotus metropolitanus TaxID=2943436 RepID=UPI0024457567|nr:uncharacterized protein LOC129593222 [Paramacrobiotus metropolitanus]
MRAAATVESDENADDSVMIIENGIMEMDIDDVQPARAKGKRDRRGEQPDMAAARDADMEEAGPSGSGAAGNAGLTAGGGRAGSGRAGSGWDVGIQTEKWEGEREGEGVGGHDKACQTRRTWDAESQTFAILVEEGME